MKLLIASDIHGDFNSAKEVIDAFEAESCDKILLLGDILYHGPRNDLPDGYNPKAVIELLNSFSSKILAVRGNCDTEVDQMVLNFPILADYCCLYLDGITVYATHGHVFNDTTPPPLCEGDILIHGHTHVPKCIEFGNKNYCLNPGSASIPKENSKKSYMIYENREFTLKDLDRNVIFSKKF